MILAALRRSRLLAGLLLVASPAGAGTLLPVVHPCPVDAPWLIPHAASAAHAGHHGGAQAAPAAEHHDHTCSCIGSCTAAAALLAPGAAFAAAPLANPPAAQGWTAHDASLQLAPRTSLLPPATAPPLG